MCLRITGVHGTFLLPMAPSNSGDHSRVAVTADGANVIWAVAGQIPYYSEDNGGSWVATDLPAPVSAYNASYHIAAGRKNPLKVYAYDHGGEWWVCYVTSFKKTVRSLNNEPHS